MVSRESGLADKRIIVVRATLGRGPATAAIKDSIDVAGFPTRHGSAVFADAEPAAANAEVVQRLLDADWKIIGKTNMHELAFGVTGINPWSGTPPNPEWPDRIPGGSSSGSAAAVAAKLVDMALGSDTGGSIRMPAACCGVIGFKPSFGRVSRSGAYPAQSSLDCVGPFARTVAMIERAMSAVAPGFTPADAPASIRIGVVQPPCDAAVAAAVATAIEATGAVQRTVDLPSLAAAFDAGLILISAENWAALGQLADHPGMGEDVRARLRAGAAFDAEAIADAEKVRRRFTDEVDGVLANCDAIALPTLPIVPPTLADAQDAQSCLPLTRLVRPFNLSGHPALTLPIITADGLPAGVQLVGRRGADEALCAIARVCSQRLGIEEKMQ